MRVLVVDDSRAVRTMIRGMLEEAFSYSVVEAGNGEEALTQFKEFPDITLAFVDWNMPVMNGLEFVEAVRKKPDSTQLRIVMVTTETEAERVMQALTAGANEYIMKPFDEDILRDKLSILGIE